MLFALQQIRHLRVQYLVKRNFGTDQLSIDKIPTPELVHRLCFGKDFIQLVLDLDISLLGLLLQLIPNCVLAHFQNVLRKRVTGEKSQSSSRFQAQAV